MTVCENCQANDAELARLREERDNYRRSASDAAVERGVALAELQACRDALHAAWSERDRLRAELADTRRAWDTALARAMESGRETARLRAENDELRKWPRRVPVDATEDDDW